MANDKSLKIGSTFDSAGVDKVTKSLQKLKKEGIEVSKAFKSINLGTGHGNATFAKSIATASNETRKFKGISEESARSFKNIWGKQVEEENKKLAHFTSRVETLSKAYQKQQKVLAAFKEQGGSPYAIKAAEARSSRFGAALIGAQTSKESYAASVKELMSDPAAMSGIMKALGVVGGIGGIIMGVSALGSAYQNSKNVSVGNLAAVGGVTGAMLSMGATNPGLFGAAMAQRNVLPGQEMTPERKKLQDMMDKDADRLHQPRRNYFGGSTSTEDIINHAGGKVATVLGDLTSPTSLFDDAFRGRLSAVETQKKMEALQDVIASMPGQQMIMGNLAATAGIRTAAARRLGGTGNSMALGLAGAHVGDDLGESLGFGMTMAERFGAQGVGFAEAGIAGQRQGIDKGFTGNFLGTAASAGANGEEVLKRIFSTGVTQGMDKLGPQFFEKIGGATATAAFTAGGPVGTEGLAAIAASFMNGMAGKTSSEAMKELDRRQQGAATADQLSQTPLMRGARMMLANNILGPGATIDAKMALAGAGLDELVAGGSGERFKNLGITSQDARALRVGQLQVVLDRYAIGNPALQKMLRKDGGVEGMMNDDHGLSMLASVASTRSGLGTQDSWKGFLDRLAGADTPLDTRGKALKDISGGAAEAQKMALASIQMTTVAHESKKTLDFIAAGVAKFVADLEAVAKGLNIESGNKTLDRVKDPGPQETKPKVKSRVTAPLPMPPLVAPPPRGPH